jgi:hypothetical protein
VVCEALAGADCGAGPLAQLSWLRNTFGSLRSAGRLAPGARLLPARARWGLCASSQVFGGARTRHPHSYTHALHTAHSSQQQR